MAIFLQTESEFITGLSVSIINFSLSVLNKKVDFLIFIKSKFSWSIELIDKILS